ncbi:hypothetical protein JKP88DRAFT_251909 [Tribonema minus]|uniref:CCHC-type domain-containing protein n=1 Tax=Tribonema minus TaxID=303371 RepID=A0A835ZGI4_9STRA|nr:hypothetical protein JKP88DRAFT_251909 [Tribonema minus]
MLAYSLASRNGDDDEESVRSAASRRPGGKGAGGAGGGAGGSGGHGSSSGRDSTIVSSSRDSSDHKSAPPAQAAPAEADADELPGRQPSLPRDGWFDTRGIALTKVQVDIQMSHIPQITLDGLSMAPLVTIQQILPDLIREKANAQRQRQRPMWPTLRNSADYGSNWFAPTLRAVIERLATSGGDNHRTKTLRGQLPGWLRQGKEMAAEADPVLLDWIFERLAKHLELRRPGELAADLVRWVVKPGLALRDFVYEFAQASSAVLSADPHHDNFVLLALLEVCRHQYPSTNSAWRAISLNPRAHTTDELLDILRGEAEHAVHDAIARKDGLAVYPANLRSYTDGTMGAGGGATTTPAAKPQQTAAQKEAARKQHLSEKQDRQISYMVFAIQTFGTGPPASRCCFNCGNDGHSFARCDQPYNAANWDAAVEKLPWVQKFRPTGQEDYRRLCARAIERAASGEAGKSAQQVYESQQREGGGRGGRRGGRGRGRSRN